jgi:acyl-CoA thioesterase FadM
MEYLIVEEQSQRQVAKGNSVLVYYDYKAGKSLEIPKGLREKFEAIEGRNLD